MNAKFLIVCVGLALTAFIAMGSATDAGIFRRLFGRQRVSYTYQPATSGYSSCNGATPSGYSACSSPRMYRTYQPRTYQAPMGTCPTCAALPSSPPPETADPNRYELPASTVDTAMVSTLSRPTYLLW